MIRLRRHGAKTLPRGGIIPHSGTAAILERQRRNLNILHCGKPALGRRSEEDLAAIPSHISLKPRSGIQGPFQRRCPETPGAVDLRSLEWVLAFVRTKVEIC